MQSKVQLIEKFNLISEYWSPKIIAELNGQYLKIAKVKGEFVWHNHENEDELFQVIKGELEIHLEKGVVLLQEGEMYVVPKGVEHKPIAQEECWILLLEPKNTQHTGKVKSDLTKNDQEWI
jgi:mannose-6-phosphate isomerase-like protein (cupin superfamily)